MMKIKELNKGKQKLQIENDVLKSTNKKYREEKHKLKNDKNTLKIENQKYREEMRKRDIKQSVRILKNTWKL